MEKITVYQRKNNLIIVKALEETSKDDALKLMSNEDLDQKELSSLIEDSLLGKFVNKSDGTPLKLLNETTMAGIRNLFDRIQNIKQ